MNKDASILLTGAAGFIGSYLLGYLSQHGYNNIVIADDFNDEDKWFNFDSKKFIQKIDRENLFEWLETKDVKIDFVFHLGARTDTTEFDFAVHQKWNIDYSKKVWEFCSVKKVPLVYASSAATYGNGELGYYDDHHIINSLQPLNPYGISKNEFDKWALQQPAGLCPPRWVGLKFFNVYGPNEYHKGRMASMVYHGFNQVQRTGKIKLFRSHRADFKNGEQLRDFIYVEDIASVCLWFMENRIADGLYNVGTGKARSFNDLAKAIFAGLDRSPVIEYIEMPEDIRDRYQYFTEAKMSKLSEAGYKKSFFTLEEGVTKYVNEYLSPKKYY